MINTSILSEKNIRESIACLKDDGELFEVRIIGKRNGRKVLISGYFKRVDDLIRAFETVDVRGVNIYITLNKLKDAVYSRDQRDRFLTTDTTTSDTEVSRYKFLFVDLDPVRPSGVSSSANEFNAAKELKTQVHDYLSSMGFSEPVEAISGNGYHLLYRVDLPADKEHTELIKACLKSLASRFDTEAVKIDTTNFNPARICKLHGTLAQKGADTAERPHRMSMITSHGSAEVTEEWKLIALAGEEIEAKTETFVPEPDKAFDLESFLASNNMGYSTEAGRDCTIYRLDECPFDMNHKNGDAKIFHYSNGAISFKCHHNSCSEYKWQDVRLLYEPDAYDVQFFEDDHHIEEGYKQHKAMKKEEPAPEPKKKEYPKLVNMRAIDLVNKHLEPLKVYVGVDAELPLLVEGTCIVSAKAKTGKSWFIQDMLIAIANGEDFLGFKTRQSSVLHMNFESGDELEQARFKKSIEAGGRSIPACYYRTNQIPDRINEGFTDMLEDFIRQDPNLGVVVIDVFQMIRSTRTSMKESDYEYAYRDIAPLNEFCKRHHISMILVTHDRKGTNPDDPFENILGSTGLQAAVSQMIVMYRIKKTDPLHISVKGKTIDGVHDFNVRFENAKFEIMTTPVEDKQAEKAEALEEYTNSPIREAILEIINWNGSYRGRASGIIQEAAKCGIALEEQPKDIGKFLSTHIPQAMKVDDLLIEKIENGTASFIYKICKSTIHDHSWQTDYHSYENAETLEIPYF